MTAPNSDWEISPTPCLTFIESVNKCKIWPKMLSGLETKYYIGQLKEMCGDVCMGPLKSTNLGVGMWPNMSI